MFEMLFHSRRCEGFAKCNAVAPEVYELDESGYLLAPPQIPLDASLREAAELGAEACPRRAIEIRDEGSDVVWPKNVIQFPLKT